MLEMDQELEIRIEICSPLSLTVGEIHYKGPLQQLTTLCDQMDDSLAIEVPGQGTVTTRIQFEDSLIIYTINVNTSTRMQTNFWRRRLLQYQLILNEAVEMGDNTLVEAGADLYTAFRGGRARAVHISDSGVCYVCRPGPEHSDCSAMWRMAEKAAARGDMFYVGLNRNLGFDNILHGNLC